MLISHMAIHSKAFINSLGYHIHLSYTDHVCVRAQGGFEPHGNPSWGGWALMLWVEILFCSYLLSEVLSFQKKTETYRFDLAGSKII